MLSIIFRIFRLLNKGRRELDDGTYMLVEVAMVVLELVVSVILGAAEKWKSSSMYMLQRPWSEISIIVLGTFFQIVFHWTRKVRLVGKQILFLLYSCLVGYDIFCSIFEDSDKFWILGWFWKLQLICIIFALII